MNKLIFDIGFNDGSDTAYYLHKGFNVVAVDANRLLVKEGYMTFKKEISEGRLHLFNIGISDELTIMPFYVNKNTGLSSFIEKLGKNDCRDDFGLDREEMVRCIPLPCLLMAFGCPYYLKIDIEGYDARVLRTLIGSPFKPDYVSIELADLEGLSLFTQMGYERFKLVSQEHIQEQQDTEDWKFKQHKSSGSFGKFLFGEWVTADEIVEQYNNRPEKDWFDLHAKFDL
jgi:FkbM family methyltransferase